jgi:hypothetical protein
MSDEENKDNPEMTPEEKAAIRGEMFADFRKQAKEMDEMIATLNKILARLGEFPPEESMANGGRLYYAFLKNQVEMDRRRPKTEVQRRD